jgi:hypothetical protein
MTVEVTFWIADPPGVSYFFVNWPGTTPPTLPTTWTCQR